MFFFQIFYQEVYLVNNREANISNNHHTVIEWNEKDLTLCDRISALSHQSFFTIPVMLNNIRNTVIK